MRGLEISQSGRNGMTMPLWKIDRTTWNSGANFRSDGELDETAASVDGLKIKNLAAVVDDMGLVLIHRLGLSETSATRTTEIEMKAWRSEGSSAKCLRIGVLEYWVNCGSPFSITPVLQFSVNSPNAAAPRIIRAGFFAAHEVC